MIIIFWEMIIIIVTAVETSNLTFPYPFADIINYKYMYYYLLHVSFLLGLFFDSENRGGMFL
jgi:hypothetical protein